jgi:hypothetical protein
LGDEKNLRKDDFSDLIDMGNYEYLMAVARLRNEIKK